MSMALYPKLAKKFYDSLWGTKIQHQPTQKTVIDTYSILSNDNVQWATIIAYSTIEQAIQNKVNNPMLFAYLLQNNFFSDLANDYIAYFNNPAPKNQVAFDKWHSKECNTIIDVLMDCNAQQIATYGIAQKIVNMTFKHLSCFSDAQKKRGHFKYCHMPIDRKIRFWINNKVVSATSSMTPWSALNNTTWSTLDETTYTNLQNAIRNHLDNLKRLKRISNKTTVLKAEFVIWPEAKDNMEKAKEAKKNNLPYTPQWTY